MAVALLTTFYGAVMAYMVFAPIAAKLERNADDERLIQRIYLVGAASIARQENPRTLKRFSTRCCRPRGGCRFSDKGSGLAREAGFRWFDRRVGHRCDC